MSLALKLALAPLLVAQALATRRRAPVLPEPNGARQGQVGAGRVLRLLIVGDSSAAGVGVRTQDRALSGHLTRTLARSSSRRVSWQLVARSGITTAQTFELLQRSSLAPADIALAVLGVNGTDSPPIGFTSGALTTADLPTVRSVQVRLTVTDPKNPGITGAPLLSRVTLTNVLTDTGGL